MISVKPEEYAATIGKRFGVALTCERFEHCFPCGPRRDPGPRGDNGGRWHYCYRVTIDELEFIGGREQEVVRMLDGIGIGLLVARDKESA